MWKKMSGSLPWSGLTLTGQKFWQFFAHILGEMMTSEIHSEIYWPLVPTYLLYPWNLVDFFQPYYSKRFRSLNIWWGILTLEFYQNTALTNKSSLPNFCLFSTMELKYFLNPQESGRVGSGPFHGQVLQVQNSEYPKRAGQGRISNPSGFLHTIPKMSRKFLRLI